ncbi:MAG: hypothetical protein M3N51_04015 [Actinomycetota bacterium]|nr:hypothetical protein [Actinomycetota bacterium]
MIVPLHLRGSQHRRPSEETEVLSERMRNADVDAVLVISSTASSSASTEIVELRRLLEASEERP